MASLIPPKRACRAVNGPSAEARASAFDTDLRQFETPQPMSRILNWALAAYLVIAIVREHRKAKAKRAEMDEILDGLTRLEAEGQQHRDQ